jgi:hypothetical protein
MSTKVSHRIHTSFTCKCTQVPRGGMHASFAWEVHLVSNGKCTKEETFRRTILQIHVLHDISCPLDAELNMMASESASVSTP